MPLTRRLFLERVAGTAGTALTYEAMTALGLLAVPARASAFDLRGSGRGTSVAILGGGLAGLATAYELGKLGYDCHVLEGRQRPGGRCHTIRRGTASEEAGSRDVCRFDEGQYYNPGPMRIPHHHATTLGYCRELGVAIEVFVNENDAAWYYQTGGGALAGKRVRAREVRTDMSGYTAELLSKALSSQDLDQPLTDGDRELLIDYLRRAGGLDSNGAYTGSSRRGYASAPGAGDHPGVASTPLALDDLLGSKTGLYLNGEFNTQATMFQVVGGSDRIAAAFAAKLGNRIIYGAEVRELRQTEDGVSITYLRNGQPQQLSASYGVCALPLNVLSALPVAELAPALKTAIGTIEYSAAGKIGLQFKRRFWEEDDGIFSGVSRTDQEISQIVYPSYGYLGRKGVLIGYYQFGGANGLAMASRTPAERIEMALAQGERIHPPYRTEFETGFSVAWKNVPWNRGGWAQFPGDARRTVYPLLIQPDGRYYFAGDHASYLTAWMCGAFESAQQAATAIHARAGRERRAAA